MKEPEDILIPEYGILNVLFVCEGTDKTAILIDAELHNVALYLQKKVISVEAIGSKSSLDHDLKGSNQVLFREMLYLHG